MTGDYKILGATSGATGVLMGLPGIPGLPVFTVQLSF